VEWKTKGCMNLEKHKGIRHKGEIFIKRYPKFWYRGDCDKCHKNGCHENQTKPPTE
jgi:hypothetical protein